MINCHKRRACISMWAQLWMYRMEDKLLDYDAGLFLHAHCAQSLGRWKGYNHGILNPMCQHLMKRSYSTLPKLRAKNVTISQLATLAPLDRPWNTLRGISHTPVVFNLPNALNIACSGDACAGTLSPLWIIMQTSDMQMVLGNSYKKVLWPPKDGNPR